MKPDTLFTLAAVVLMVACNADPPFVPTSASLRVSMAHMHGVDPASGDLHVSILWYDPDFRTADTCGKSKTKGSYTSTHLYEQPLELEPTTSDNNPDVLSVAINEPPPRAVLHQSVDDHDIDSAGGDLVIYRDANGNGRLDPRGLDGESPDQVLGSGQGPSWSVIDQPAHYTIVYLTRSLSRKANSASMGDGKAGYSLEIDRYLGSSVIPEVEFRRLDAAAPIELALADTPYGQHWACSETCNVRAARDCPMDPSELLNDDLGELEPIHEPGESFWMREDGARTIVHSAQCMHGVPHDGNPVSSYVFDFQRMTHEGCTRTFEGCHYEQSSLPEGVELPCSEYLDVSFADQVSP